MNRNERTDNGGAVVAAEHLVHKVVEVAEEFRQAGTAMKTAACEMLEAAKQNAVECSKEGWAKVNACERKVADRIRQQPILWVAGAAGAGIVLGLALCAARGRRS